MTLGKSLALAIGFVCAMALGIWVGPYVREHAPFNRDHQTAAHEPARPAPAPQAAQRSTAAPTRASAPRAAAPTVTLDQPALHARLKPVLNRGTNMTIAAEGFHSAEEFAMVAHAAKNTEVPFMVLKHRVLTEGKSLAKAIRESKPDVNANAEVRRAKAEARTDLQELAS
jgi:hypothetical protein